MVMKLTHRTQRGIPHLSLLMWTGYDLKLNYLLEDNEILESSIPLEYNLKTICSICLKEKMQSKQPIHQTNADIRGKKYGNTYETLYHNRFFQHE